MSSMFGSTNTFWGGERRREAEKMEAFYTGGAEIKEKEKPGTRPVVSFQSTQSHDRRSPPSPLVWDGHAGPTWGAQRSCTYRGDDDIIEYVSLTTYSVC